MASQSIKQVRIPKESLPSINVRDNFFGYRLRYRVITNDRNSFSAWSPIYDISADGVVDVANTQYTININPILSAGGGRSKTQVNLVWTPPIGLTFYSFDIFIKTNLDSDFVLYRTVTSTSYDVIIPARDSSGLHEITTAKFWVQLSTSDKKPNLNLKMFPKLGVLDGDLRLDLASPTITKITPNSGPVTGGTIATITGTGFIEGATVQVGGNDTQATTFVNSTSIIVSIPPNSTTQTLAADVVVSNPDTQTATATGGFTYVVV